ncbi:MAG TPA: HNH endonuclease signature motif containing protein [Myxococcota bacterium]|nr:HNH endonuclease signature motif containing protein [Myxococcota bacterium]
MNTSAQSLHQELLDAVHASRALDHRIAVLLLEARRTALFQDLGFASLIAYAREALDIGGAKVKVLLSLAERVPALPALEAAFSSGSLSYTKAARLLPVVTTDNVEEWIERARNISNRVLEQQLSGREPGDLPPDPEEELPPPRVRRSFMLEAADSEVLDRAIALLRVQSGVDSDDLDAGRLVGLIIRRGAMAVEQQAEEPPTEPIYRTVVTRCPDCAAASSPDFMVMDHVATQAEDDGDVLDLTDGPDRGQLTRHVPDRTRRAVLARDAYRCVFPGCTCTLFLQLHHGVPFADGGTHEEANLFTLCSVHHAAVHEGRCALFRNREGPWLAVHRGGIVEPSRVGLGKPGVWRRHRRSRTPLRGAGGRRDG